MSEVMVSEMEPVFTNKRTKASQVFATLGDLRFLLGPVTCTVTAQQKCERRRFHESERARHYWHYAGRVGLQALQVAAQHGLASQLKGSHCSFASDAHEEKYPVHLRRHGAWLTSKQAQALLVAADLRQTNPKSRVKLEAM